MSRNKATVQVLEIIPVPVEGEALGFVFRGVIVDDESRGKFFPGQLIRSSLIQSIDIEGKLIKTLNTDYTLV